MTSTQSDLLSKWTLGTGVGSKSKLSGSLLSSSIADKAPAKRKPAGLAPSFEASESKKLRDVGARSNLTSSLLTSSGLGRLSSTRPSSGGNFKSDLAPNLGGTSSLLSGGGHTRSSALSTSGLQGSAAVNSRLSSSLLGTSTSKQSSGLVSSLSAGNTLLSSGTSSLLTSSRTPVGGVTSLSISSSSFGTSTRPQTGSFISQNLTGGSILLSSTLKGSLISKSEQDQKPTEKKGKPVSGKGKKRKKDQRYNVSVPKYDFSQEIEVRAEIVLPKFIPPEKDRALLTMGIKLHDVNGLKMALMNAVSGSLICQPNFTASADPTRVALMQLTERVIPYDPEFILKLALYTRQQLNIRTTGNFLLALSSHTPACRQYLRRYFSASIQLPSDWIEVAEIYQAFPEKTLPLGSLPSALRRAMVAKFPDFDKYQLAKYNKESSKKKKNKKAKGTAVESNGRGRGRGRGRGQVRGRGRGRGGIGGQNEGPGRANKASLFDSDSSSSDEDSDEENDREFRKHQERLEKGLDTVLYDDQETKEQLQKMSFTLKQLIRKLHITNPVEHVMCLIGKKYPMTLEEFYASRLPGTFEEERAGKRMKLPIPETWETQVSLKGNKATTWEQLIDHKKLPFMAMLRNLRNLIKAGISQKHHNWVLRRLTDERTVINSRQFPFRFFSAYEVLEQLQKDFEKSQADIVRAAEEAAAGVSSNQTTVKKVKLTSENWWIEKKKRKEGKNKKEVKETPFDTALINRYRKALDTAVKLATVYNVQPIRGTTIILCDRGSHMSTPCTAARGLGKPRTMLEVSLLLGLMCKYSCEESKLVMFDNELKRYTSVEVDKGTILENMSRVLEMDLEDFPADPDFSEGLPVSILKECVRDRVQVDNVLLLTGGTQYPGQRPLMAQILETYRRLVNPNLLYVNVSFAGKSCGFDSSIQPEHDNNIYISGFSDQILRFIAERGDGGQLRHVEKIDEAFNLKPLPAVLGVNKPAPPKLSIEKPLELSMQTPCWRTARVFISSTFRDMHGERDLLTRFVFPELRALGRKHFIHVYEVDLRWGVTEEETRSNKTLEMCLTEISKCQFFMGMLGERYGWVPDKYEVPDRPEFDWVREYRKGASITELEMYSVTSQPKNMKDRAFFYLRDNAFECDVPKVYQEDFISESDINAEKMSALKTSIKRSGMEVFDDYPCRWGGVVDDKPLVSGLEEFGARALNNLWTAIRKYFPDESTVIDEGQHINKLHEAYVANLKKLFVGRKKIIKDVIKQIYDAKSGIITMIGKPGTGKSSLMASVISEYIVSKACSSSMTVLTHFVGAAPGSGHLLPTLRRLCHELNTRFTLDMEIAEDYKNLVSQFADILKQSASLCSSPLVLFVDGVDNMDPVYLPHNLDWLPETLPENVIIILTCLTDSKLHKTLQRRMVNIVTVEGLDMWDKSEVVRSHLAIHRKSLDESPFNNQMKLLVSKKDANIPLYLSIVCEELRVYGLFNKMTGKLKSLPQTVPLLLQEVLSRLESDLGTDLVSTALCLLLIARDGLLSEELHDLLSLFTVVAPERPSLSQLQNIQLKPTDYLPAATFAHLRTSLLSLLNPTETWTDRLELTHVDIEKAVQERYLKASGSAETRLFLHRLMAVYLYSQADPENSGKWNGKSARAFQELPYHLAKSGNFETLEEVLCSLQFLCSKSQLGLAASLMEDYQPQEYNNKTLERDQAKYLKKQRVVEYKLFVARNLHIMASHPALTWQQAFNESAGSKPAVDMKSLMSSGINTEMMGGLMELQSKSNLPDPCYLTIANLPQPMTCVAVSSDNRYFACGGLDCLVYLYDLQTGKELRSFRGHADSVTDVCFAGNDKICSASKDKFVSIWDVHGGHRLFTLKGHTRMVNSCSSDISGKLLATASWDCTIKVWSTSKGEMVCDFKVGSPVNCVSFHPEGQLIVSGQWDSTIKIWDVFHKTKKAVLRGHMSSVRDVAYSPSGRHIASAALDGDVKLWASYVGSQVGNITGHALPINKLTFSPSGQELITVSDDHKVKVWSGHLGKPLHTVGEEEFGAAMSVALSSDGEIMAVGYHSGFIKTFDVISGSELKSRQVHTASVRSLKFTSTNYVLSGSDDNIAKMLTPTLKDCFVFSEQTKPVICVDLCQEFIAIGSEDCCCRLYEIPNPRMYTGGNRMCQSLCVLVGHVAPVTSCCFNAKGSLIATASRDMSVRIWDVVETCLNSDNPTPLKVLSDCHADWITDCKWSNTGDVLVTASTDFNLKIWDTKTGKEKVKLTGHMGAVNHVAYMYGCIVSTCADGSVKVWSHKGVEITTLYGHTQRSNGCDILVKLVDAKTEDIGDGDWASEEKEDKGKMLQPKIMSVLVATAGDDGTTRLWQPLQANELSCLTGHSDKVVSVASDSKGNLCTSSLDRAVKVWSHDQAAGTPAACHNAPITFLCSQITGNHELLISGSRDGECRLWIREIGKGQTGFTVSSIIQAHDKAVTCGCWMKDGQFVTGGNDGSINVWSVTMPTDTMAARIRKQNIFFLNLPVISVVCGYGKIGQLLFSINWGGVLHVLDLEKQRVIHTEQTLFRFPCLLQKMVIVDSHVLLICTSDGTIYKYDISDVLLGKAGIHEIGRLTVPTADTVSFEGIPDHKIPANWVLDMAGSNKDLVSVDSRGQLTRFLAKKVPKSVKIHATEITCVVRYEEYIFTAAADKTIKVWDDSCTQIGQFFCASPVTSMIVLKSSGPQCVCLACADYLGFVNFLNWRTG